MLLLGAEAHDMLDPGAIVPTPIEQHDFTARWQLRYVTLEIPLAPLLLGRCAERDNPANPWVEALSNALYHAALARCVAPLEQHADPQAVQPHPFLQLNQFELQMDQFLDVMVVLRRCARHRPVSQL